MARERVLKIGALNITTHPHSPSNYVELLMTARVEKLVVHQRGNRYALIGFVRPHKNDPLDALEGQLFSFVDIDRDAAWLNIETGKQAEDAALEEVNIPEQLKPELRRFNFMFFPGSHRLVIESYSHEGFQMSPKTSRDIFERLLNSETLLERFGPVEVVVEPEVDAVSKILKMHSLKRLKIVVSRPNADTTEEVEEEVFRRLDEQKSDFLIEEYHAQAGSSLEPNKRTRSLSRVAASNGYVEGRGRNEAGEPAHESTVDHPITERISYDPNTQPPTMALAQAAGTLLRKILGR